MSLKTVTTIVTPAATYNLTDLATVHDELSIPTGDTTKDPWINRAISQASATVAQYCNRVLVAETIQDFIYVERDVYGREEAHPQLLQLSRWPVVSVTSVVDAEGNTLVAGADYVLDADDGQMIRLNTSGFPARWRYLPVTVVYVGGFATIPADIVDGVLRLITARFTARGRDPTLRSQDDPKMGRQEFWVGGPPMSGSMPQEIAAILDNYRAGVFA